MSVFSNHIIAEANGAPYISTNRGFSMRSTIWMQSVGRYKHYEISYKIRTVRFSVMRENLLKLKGLGSITKL